MANNDKLQVTILVIMGLLLVVMFVQLQLVNAKLNTLNGNRGGNTLPTENVIANNQPVQAAPSAPEPTVQVSIDDDAILGNKDAPVTLVEFSDYQCPFCGRFHEQAFPQIKSEYIDTGKVRFVFRDFPLSFHENAQKSAEAAECAGEQEKYWAYNEVLFKNQDKLSVSDLKGYAKELGLDETAFNSCLDSGKMASEVAKDMNDGAGYGVKGTPAVFVNGKLISGAQPFSAFKQAIDAALA
ncbi:MAG: DsbA family protein [Nanoarchaeota archaeon]